MAIQQVSQTDSLEQGRQKWNSNDQELKDSIDAITNSMATDAELATEVSTLQTQITSNDTDITTIQTLLPIFYKKFNGSEGTTDTDGLLFDLSSQVGSSEALRSGSVEVSVNGIFYISDEVQTTTSGNIDFHIENRAVVWHNITNGGSLDLVDSDVIMIHYQKA